MSKISVIFFGTPEFAIASLEALINDEHYDIKAVVTRSDKPAGRGKKMQSSPVKLKALENNIIVLEPEILDEQFFNTIKNLQLDIAVVIAYGKILPQKLLDIPVNGCVNVHPSLLPKYRGSSPMSAAILNSDTVTGVSIMLLDQKMDHGPILLQQALTLASNIYLPELHDKLAVLGSQLLLQALDGYLSGFITPKEQNHTVASFTQMIQKDSGQINWSKPAVEVYAHIRAYTGWPGAFTFFNNKKLEITQVNLFSNINTINNQPKYQSGTVVEIDNNICVVCDDNSLLKLERVKLEGKKEMHITDFICGQKDFLNSILSLNLKL